MIIRNARVNGYNWKIFNERLISILIQYWVGEGFITEEDKKKGIDSIMEREFKKENARISLGHTI
jgi:hypothetical protein